MTPRTLFDKIWEAHVVAEQPGEPSLLYVDLHLVHEVTSPQAFESLRIEGLTHFCCILICMHPYITEVGPHG